MIMSVSLQVLGKAICPVLISRCACLYECPPVRSVCFYCPVQNVVNHRLRWAHPRVCGENKKWHKCHVCSENSLKMTLRLVHFEPSQPPAFEIQSILLTIQHHYDSPGMTKARDPRPARKNGGLAGFPRHLQMSGLRPPLSYGLLFQAWWRGTNPTGLSLTGIKRES